MGLILTHVRDNNVDAIERFLEKKDRWLDTEEDLSRSFLLRVQLWRDIYREDSQAADTHFVSWFYCRSNQSWTTACTGPMALSRNCYRKFILVCPKILCSPRSY